MDMKITATRPTPSGVVDVGAQLASAVNKTPLAAIIGPALTRIVRPAVGAAAEKAGSLLSVTVIIVNDSQIGAADSEATTATELTTDAQPTAPAKATKQTKKAPAAKAPKRR